MGKYLLGLDCGHTVTKAVLFDLTGKQLSVGKGKNLQISQHPGWQERTMHDAAEAALDAISEAIKKIDSSEIVAVGVAGHGDGIYLLDKHHQPLRNAIFATDNRASAIASEINRVHGDALMKSMGQHLFAASPMALLSWMKSEEPEKYQNIGAVLQCKDWIRTVLTGTVGSDISDAACAGLGLNTYTFDKSLFDSIGIPEVFQALPELKFGGEVAGGITETIAVRTGLKAGTPVIAGVHDVHAAAIGVGAFEFGDVSLIFGTWSINQVFANTPKPDSRWHTHASIEKSRWLHMCTSPASASNANWFWELFGISELEELEKALKNAEKSLLSEDRAFFMPYLFGGPAGTTPGASLIGARGWHTQSDINASVIEGIVFNHKHHFDMLSEKVDTSGRIIATGGSMQSDIWAQLVADVFNRDIEISDADESGARGLAILAGVSQGIYSSIEDGISQTVSTRIIFKPNPNHVPFFAQRYKKYREHAKNLTNV